MFGRTGARSSGEGDQGGDGENGWLVVGEEGRGLAGQ